MHFFLGIIGMLLAYGLIRYREPVGEMIGDPEWAGKIGGIYNVLVLFGIFIFLWSIAYMTGTMEILFYPVVMFLPHGERTGGM